MTPALGRAGPLVFASLAPEDAEGLYAAVAGPEVARYLGAPDVTDLADTRRRIARALAGPGDVSGTALPETWVHLVVREIDGPVVGRLEATLRPGWAEVAWVLGAPWWGRGYGTLGARFLSDHLAEEYDTCEIWASAHPDNVASIAIMRGLGMELQNEPYARDLASRDPGDAIFARLVV